MITEHPPPSGEVGYRFEYAKHARGEKPAIRIELVLFLVGTACLTIGSLLLLYLQLLGKIR